MNRREMLQGTAGSLLGVMALTTPADAEEKVAESLAAGDLAKKEYLLKECDMKYYHVGIPTKDDMKWDAYLEEIKVHIQEYENDPFGIEWLKFEDGSPLPKVLQERPHVAFLVNDLEKATHGMELIVPISVPRPGIKTCFVLHKGIGIEFVCRIPK